MPYIKNKIKNNLSKLMGLGTLGFATYAGSLITAAFLIYIAPILGSEDYGKISYYFAIANVTFAISFLGMGNVLLVYLPKGLKILSSVSFLSLITGSVASVIIYFIFYDVGLCLLVFGLGIFDIAQNELAARKLYRGYAKYTLVNKTLFVIFGLSLYYIMGASGIILGLALSFLPSIIRVCGGFKESNIDMTIIKTHFRFIINNYVSQLSRVSSGYLDRIVIFPLFGSALLGNYELGLQILTFAYLFPMIIYRYILPRDSVGQYTKKLKITTIVGSIIFAMFTIFLIPKLLPLFFPQFTKTVELISIMGLAIIPHTVVFMYISKFLGNEKSKIVVVGSILRLLIQITGIVIMGSAYGNNGIASALVMAEVAEAIYLLSLNRLIFKNFI